MSDDQGQAKTPLQLTSDEPATAAVEQPAAAPPPLDHEAAALLEAGGDQFKGASAATPGQPATLGSIYSHQQRGGVDLSHRAHIPGLLLTRGGSWSVRVPLRLYDDDGLVHGRVNPGEDITVHLAPNSGQGAPPLRTKLRMRGLGGTDESGVAGDLYLTLIADDSLNSQLARTAAASRGVMIGAAVAVAIVFGFVLAFC